MSTGTVVLTPSPARGSGLPTARTARVLAEDGALVHVLPDGRREVLCPPGTVAWAALVGNTVGEGEVVVRGAGRTWVLPVAAWYPGIGPGRPGGHTLGSLADATGARALAEALGTTLTVTGRLPDEPDAAALRTVVDDRVPAPGWPDLVRLPLVVVTLLAVLGTPFAVDVLDRDPAWAAPASAAVATVAVTLWAFGVVGWPWWRAGRRVVPPVPQVDQGELLLRPDQHVPAPVALRRRSWLLVGPERVAVRASDGREAWLPGPALGGVVRAALVRTAPGTPTAVPGRPGETSWWDLERDDGTLLVRLPGSVWAAPTAAAEVREALAGAGAEVAAERTADREEPVDVWLSAAYAPLARVGRPAGLGLGDEYLVTMFATLAAIEAWSAGPVWARVLSLAVLAVVAATFVGVRVHRRRLSVPTAVRP